VRRKEMRIFSQDGLFDYPYEHCTLFVSNKERTILSITMYGDDYADLAEYNSEEDAKFALRYIFACYACGYNSVEVPSAETIHKLRFAYERKKNPGESFEQFWKRMEKRYLG
jgi:hypothetical protein